MSKPRKRRRLPVLIATAESTALLAAAAAASSNAKSPSKEFAAWRDFVMIQTGILAGPRVSEMCDLKITDVDLSERVLRIVWGKGGRDRNVPIGKKLLGVLREWIGERRDGYLFPGPKGKRLNRRTFQYRLDTLAEAAGIRKSLHPHLLRHFFACSYLRAGGDIRELMDIMGHAHLSTTAIYLSADVNRFQAAMDRL